MYQIKKVLSHNAVLVRKPKEKEEFLIIGKGIGFGRKRGDEIEPRSQDKVYSLCKLD